MRLANAKLKHKVSLSRFLIENGLRAIGKVSE